jgi:protein-arginine kinase activator protein McsA
MKDNKSTFHNAEKDISQNFTCRSCGMKFDTLGDMQKHITVEHHQKGDVP